MSVKAFKTKKLTMEYSLLCFLLKEVDVYVLTGTLVSIDALVYTVHTKVIHTCTLYMYNN